LHATGGAGAPPYATAYAAALPSTPLFGHNAGRKACRVGKESRVLSDIKLIALDLDGTLVHDAKRIPEANLQAVKRAMARGITVAIATGRMHSSAETFVSRLGLEGTPLISYNGAMVRVPGAAEPMLHVAVPPDLAALVVQHAVEEGFHLNYFLNDVLYVTHMDHWAWLYHSRTGNFPVLAGDLRRFNGESPTKLLIAARPADVDGLLPREQALFGDRLYVTRSMPEYIEFLNPAASKGAALKWLAEHLGLAREQVMAMGDMLNDLPMIEWAGIGVAMPDAEEVVRAAADFVPGSSEEGVAEAIAKFTD
jgi:Cof subfamily protein (haloacid dehalogenase superfamily)